MIAPSNSNQRCMYAARKRRAVLRPRRASPTPFSQIPRSWGTEDDIKTTTWQDWYASVERPHFELRRDCETVIVGGLSTLSRSHLAGEFGRTCHFFCARAEFSTSGQYTRGGTHAARLHGCRTLSSAPRHRLVRG